MIEEDQNNLVKVIKEISNSMARKQGEQEYITEAIKETAKKYEMDVKVLRKICKVYFKQSLTEEIEEIEDFKITYQNLFGISDE